MVIRNTQGAEGVLKQYEDCLREVHVVPSDVKEVETYRTNLKVYSIWFLDIYLQVVRIMKWLCRAIQKYRINVPDDFGHAESLLVCFCFIGNPQKMRAEAEGEQPVFDSLEEELKKASAVSDKMSRVHSERDAELDQYRQHLSSLQDRWKAVFTQIDLRQRELEQLGRQLGYYRESYDWLIRWIGDAKQRQETIQAVPITDSKTLKEQLAQEKVYCVALCIILFLVN